MGHTLLLAFAALLLVGCADPNILEKHYDSRAQVVADDAIHRGWIPDWLPEGASDISELHNIDTSESLLRFNYPKGSELSVPTGCARLQAAQAPEPRYSRIWWPTGIPADSRSTTSYVFFRCDGYYAGYSGEMGVAVVWR